MLTGDVPLRKPKTKQLKFIIRNFSKSKPVESKFYIYDHRVEYIKSSNCFRLCVGKDAEEPGELGAFYFTEKVMDS